MVDIAHSVASITGLVADLLYPPGACCAGCGRRLVHPQPKGCAPGLCPSCQLLVQRHPEVCPVCGCRPAVVAWMDGTAGHLCVTSELPGSLHCIGPYRGRLRQLIELYRDHLQNHLVESLGFLMSQRLGIINFRASTSALVPIPSSPRRCRARGFDPVESLARATGKLLGVPTLSLLCCPTDSRTEFILGRIPPETLQSVVLMDDIYTGAGISRAAAAALRQGFSGTVRVAALAALDPGHERHLDH